MRSPFLVVSVNIFVLFGVLSAQKQSHMCKKLLKSPNFDIDRVVGRPWRIYYSWVMEYGERCVEITFKKLNRTSGIKHRFASNLASYMKDEVVWEDATLLLSKSPVIYRDGEMTKEMLLFPKGQKGFFDGVHDLSGDFNNYYLSKHSLPLNQLVLKLFRKGKYLVIADCRQGITFLMTRSNETIHRLEVQSLASEICDDESGYPSCSTHKNTKEVEGVLMDDNKIL